MAEQELQWPDVRGDVTITFEAIVCRRCKHQTALTFTITDQVDYCGFCEEPYRFPVSFGLLFGTPETIFA